MRRVADNVRLVANQILKGLRRPGIMKKFNPDVAIAPHLDKAVAIVAQSDEAVAVAYSSKKLSPEGVRDAYEAAAKKAHDDLGALYESTVEKIRERIAVTEKAIFAAASGSKPSPEDAILRALRQREIRDAFRSLDQAARTAVYVTLTDAETIEAFETAPLVLELGPGSTERRVVAFVNDKIRDAKVLDRARRAKPELADELDELEQIARSIATVINTAHQAVADVVAPTPAQGWARLTSGEIVPAAAVATA